MSLPFYTTLSHSYCIIWQYVLSAHSKSILLNYIFLQHSLYESALLTHIYSSTHHFALQVFRPFQAVQLMGNQLRDAPYFHISSIFFDISFIFFSQGSQFSSFQVFSEFFSIYLAVFWIGTLLDRLSTHQGYRQLSGVWPDLHIVFSFWFCFSVFIQDLVIFQFFQFSLLLTRLQDVFSYPFLQMYTVDIIIIAHSDSIKLFKSGYNFQKCRLSYFGEKVIIFFRSQLLILSKLFIMADKFSAPGYSMGTSKKSEFAKINGVPGPGSYSYLPTIKSERSQKKMPNQKRFDNYETIAPGPGSYTYKNNTDHIPGAIVKSRIQQKQTNEIPGPGAYEPDFTKFMKSQSSYKIGREKQRKSDVPKTLMKNPGPGTYQAPQSSLLQSQLKAIKFGPQRNIVLQIDKKTPGPGAYNQTGLYNATSQINEPKYHFGKAERSKSTYNLTSPGPGAYGNNGIFDESVKNKKGFSIGEKSPKNSTLMGSFGPGPADYNVNQIDITKMKKSTPSFSIGKNAKLKIDNIREHLSKPGPQAYQTKTSVFNHQSFSIGKDKRKGLQTINVVPGPGAYQPRHNQSQPVFSVSKGLRPNISPKNENPGPGNYEPVPKYNEQFHNIGLGKDTRRTFEVRQKFPGPGQYKSPTNKSFGGFTIGHDKRSHERKSDIPGPGNYNIPSAISNLPSYSVKK